MKKYYLLSLLLLLPGITVAAQTFVNFTINQPPQLTADAGPASAICPGGNASLAGLAGGGDGAYTYSWSPNATVNDPGNANTTADPTTTTTYTLLITDGNNCTASDNVIITVMNCAGIENENALSTSIYPNPSQGAFQLTLQGADGIENVSVKIYATTGALVYEKSLGKVTGNAVQTIDLSILAKGNYTLMLYAEDQLAHTQKISIQ